MSLPTVLITGATGFLGGAATAALLRRQPPCRTLLLVRGVSQDAAEERVRRSLARFVEEDHGPAPDRFEVIRGDLTEPDFLVDPRLDDVTHVLHLAANTSFRSVRRVRHTNILGALALAHRMRRVAGLVRYLHVGTAYICGANAPRLVHEDD